MSAVPVKEYLKQLPLLGGLARSVRRRLKPSCQFHSAAYWEARYANGGDSGVGSYAKFADFKAEVLNEFVQENKIEEVIEFGCGDGNQVVLADYPYYTGYDVSSTAVAMCRTRFAQDLSKAFRLASEYQGETADLTLSLDVIYHLVEDAVFAAYMRQLFGASRRYVIIYSSNKEDNYGREDAHVRHRKFTSWIAQNLHNWELVRHIPNRYPYQGDFTQGSFAEFFIYSMVVARKAGTDPQPVQRARPFVLKG
jgi:hypothetical protein